MNFFKMGSNRSGPMVCWTDRVGGCVSMACAVHCALEPILILLPSIGSIGFLAKGTLEQIVLAGGLSLATASVFFGLRRHGKRRILFPFMMGTLLIVLGRSGYTDPLKTGFVIFGGLAIAVTHVLNILYDLENEPGRECGRMKASDRPETC